MDSEELDSNLRVVLRRLSERRGACPSSGELTAFSQDSQADSERRAVEAHLEVCGLCQSLVDRLRAPDVDPGPDATRRAGAGLDSRPAPWRRPRSLWSRYPGLAAAAVLLIAAAPALWVWRHSAEPGPSAPAVERGSAIQLLEPAGRLERVDLFRWNALPAYASFRLRIQEGDSLIWEATASETRFAAGAELQRKLAAGARFRWSVQGLDDRGQVVAESGWVTFEIAH